jgi:hypothetical protein
MVLTPGQAAEQLRMVDKNPAQLVPQRIVFESILQGAHHHDFLASEGWWANADGRGLITTTYSHEVLRGEERTGDTGAWAVSIIATGMPAKKQLQFRANIKANRKPWDSKVEFTMPGELKLYRDYKLTDVSEYASASGKKDAKPETKERLNYALNPKNKDGYDSKWQHSARLASAATRTNCITCKMAPRERQSDKCNQCQLAVFNM